MARKKFTLTVPSFDELLVPVVKALIKLGGSGSVEEINNLVYEIAKISEDILQIAHSETDSRKEVDYRLAWSRTYLKKFGLLENSSRGIWALVNSDIDVANLDNSAIVRYVREKSTLEKLQKSSKESQAPLEVDKEVEDELEDAEKWKEDLLEILY